MPSTLLTAASGVPLISGNFWSGRQPPLTGVQLFLDINASGSAYISLSGGFNVNSGGFFLSGGGLMDGVKVPPNGSYFVPKLALSLLSSGGPLGIYVACDPACSGQARLYWECF